MQLFDFSALIIFGEGLTLIVLLEIILPHLRIHEPADDPSELFHSPMFNHTLDISLWVVML